MNAFPFSPIAGIVLRYFFLYTRNGLRAFELFFWPLNTLLVWGFLTRYLSHAGAGEVSLPVSFLLGGVLLWDVQFRATQGVSVSFLEDVWTRNLLNVFVAPVRTWELVAGFCTVGLLRVVITVPILSLMAFLAFQFNLLEFNFWLVPFFGNLLLFGWSMGMLANALVLRWGQAAEGLAWALPFLLQPFTAVYYTVETLPRFLQPFSLALPSTHVFEAMRHAMAGNAPIAQGLVLAFGLNLLWLGIASLVMHRVLGIARERGLLTKVATQ
ncbi:MAG: ABC-2 type transport system permease protein [Verrucomicrobia bacterium]|nr:MAG: ABC-2 type transport system permease protein [Verrucomicrobiota bacterium]